MSLQNGIERISWLLWQLGDTRRQMSSSTARVNMTASEQAWQAGKYIYKGLFNRVFI